MAVPGQRDAVGLIADVGVLPRLGVDRLHDLVLRRVDHRYGVVEGVGDEQRSLVDVQGGGVQTDVDRLDRSRRPGGVDDAHRAGGRGAPDRAGRHLGAVGLDRGLTRPGRPATLVADEEPVSHQSHTPRGDADIPRLLERSRRGVEGLDRVLTVDRDEQRAPSAENVDFPGSGEWPSTTGIGKVNGAPSVPSALTGNRVSPFFSGKQQEFSVR